MEVLYNGKRPTGTGNRYTRKIIEAFQKHQHPAVIAITPSATGARHHLIECKRSKIVVRYEVHHGFVNLALYETMPATADSPFSYQKFVEKQKFYLGMAGLEDGLSTEFHQVVNLLIKWLTKVTPYTNGLVDKPPVYPRPGVGHDLIGGKIVGVKSDIMSSDILLEGGYTLTIPVDDSAQVGQYLLYSQTSHKVVTHSEFLDNYAFM